MAATESEMRALLRVVTDRHGQAATDLATLRFMAAVRFTEPVSQWTELLREAVDALADVRGIDRNAVNAAVVDLVRTANALSFFKDEVG